MEATAEFARTTLQLGLCNIRYLRLVYLEYASSPLRRQSYHWLAL